MPPTITREDLHGSYLWDCSDNDVLYWDDDRAYLVLGFFRIEEKHLLGKDTTHLMLARSMRLAGVNQYYLRTIEETRTFSEHTVFHGSFRGKSRSIKLLGYTSQVVKVIDRCQDVPIDNAKIWTFLCNYLLSDRDTELSAQEFPPIVASFIEGKMGEDWEMESWDIDKPCFLQVNKETTLIHSESNNPICSVEIYHLEEKSDRLTVNETITLSEDAVWFLGKFLHETKATQIIAVDKLPINLKEYISHCFLESELSFHDYVWEFDGNDLLAIKDDWEMFNEIIHVKA